MKSFAPVKYSKRWFAHIDLLGFTHHVENDKLDTVLSTYESALANLDDSTNLFKGRGIHHSWFSDTFIIYSSDDSAEQFKLVETLSHRFLNGHIYKQILARGAIACHNFYSQKEKNIFIGQALIESHEYGEDQNWIGLILTPSATENLKDVEPSVLNSYQDIPKNVLRKKQPNGVKAYTFKHGYNNGEMHGLRECLETMRDKLPFDEKFDSVRQKYDRTICFINKQIKIHQKRFHGIK